VKKLLVTVSCSALLAVAAFGMTSSARANDKLDEMSRSDENWVMPGKDYHSDNYSKMTQINKENVKQLRMAWSFSTGVLNGHEGAPLVVGDMMYVHTSFPNITFALNLNDPGKIVWEHKPKQNPAARAVACCDLVNRGLAYWPGDAKTPPLILKTLLDGHIVALNAKTGAEVWKMENSDIKVGSTLTIAPYVVHDKVIVGSSGAELGVRGYVTAYDVHDGAQVWRAYATGPDKALLLAKDFNIKNPQYGQKNLGLETWEGDAWKIGGGTNWGWYAYDPKTNLIYFGTGNPRAVERDDEAG
jgi:methanol dehydrogenase (cytochrome c) subunit 1